MVRHLVRQCHRRHHVPALLLRIYRHTDDTDLALLFRDAEHHAPCLVILEDLDSLTRECRVSRAHLLDELDGVDSKEGLLVIGTTNNPEDIDPALVHRPSRFDRVWHFELPDRAMRQRYLEWAFPEPTVDTPTLAAQSSGWSYAYLNELRTTAAILAMSRNAAGPTAEDVRAALARLLSQFESGRRNHSVAGAGNLAGFLPESQ
jgi:SpoVK/Ycf46/Vps4 family AAA+-type ATPase